MTFASQFIRMKQGQHPENETGTITRLFRCLLFIKRAGEKNYSLN